MKICGLVITTAKRAADDTAALVENWKGLIDKLQDKMEDITADRDSANKQIQRLLHNGVELPILWASIRDAGHEKQIRVIYKRLMGGK